MPHHSTASPRPTPGQHGTSLTAAHSGRGELARRPIREPVQSDVTPLLPRVLTYIVGHRGGSFNGDCGALKQIYCWPSAARGSGHWTLGTGHGQIPGVSGARRGYEEEKQTCPRRAGSGRAPRLRQGR
ncbi:hypothetical protein E2C01_075629 [Portunus trituberculatus]|uniref:Uncharacterized protein n=1 Tax=Portunus trituberculatus TaxID=210409 RepID=A0A5B7IGL7_PORTR|nr:hypothetical protein [Portunus trituberculatus]